MIFYFSATGNCKYVANKLAEVTGETTVSITECLKVQNVTFEIKDGERIGFVTPTYFWGLPIVVVDFLEQINLISTGKHYVYHVLTYGTTTGPAHQIMSGYLAKKGLPLDGKFSIRMVDTWTPIFNLTDQEKNKEITDAAEIPLADVADKVKRNIAGDFNKRKLPEISSAFWIFQNKYGRKTKKFYVEDSCISCGLCSKICPVGAIHMQDGRPVWSKEQCALCLGCLHRCPNFAIQYGRRTKKHGQFVNPNVKLK